MIKMPFSAPTYYGPQFHYCAWHVYKIFIKIGDYRPTFCKMSNLKFKLILTSFGQLPSYFHYIVYFPKDYP